MKKMYFKKLSLTSILAIAFILLFTNCEREISDAAVEATYPKIADIYTDNPIGLTDVFFHSDDPANGANVNGFDVDNEVAYVGRSSVRIDVPAPNDPDGGYVGGVFIDRGNGRNLTNFDALTFYVKASRTVTSGVTFGFGSDYLANNEQDVNKFRVTTNDMTLSTNWKKVIIPIPDPSKLTQLKGLFILSAGTQGTAGVGYTFWLDEIRFEKLGTIAQNQVAIKNGNNVTETTFVGVNSGIDGVIASFNMPNGLNQSVTISPAYLNFSSSNPDVATVNASGVVTSLSAGTSAITATFNGALATGSLIINCVGNFVAAPTPTRNPANVISIFSNQYNNVPVNYYNGYWAPWQTTVSNDFSVLGNDILNYTIFNFVGIEFSNPTVNAGAMTHIHLDAFIPGPIIPGRQLRVLVVDFGANGVFGGGDDTRHSTTFTAPFVVSQNWMSIDIPFSAMPNLQSRTNLAQIILEGGDGSVIYVDNIYFYN
jgi:hypothetical protein